MENTDIYIYNTKTSQNGEITPYDNCNDSELNISIISSDDISTQNQFKQDEYTFENIKKLLEDLCLSYNEDNDTPHLLFISVITTQV